MCVFKRNVPKRRVARFFLVQLTKAGKICQNGHWIYQMVIKYSKWKWNRPNGHKIYQHISLQDTRKFTQIGIFGLKICHLATLPKRASVCSRAKDSKVDVMFICLIVGGFGTSLSLSLSLSLPLPLSLPFLIVMEYTWNYSAYTHYKQTPPFMAGLLLSP
jgi:hypothetical protein